MPMNYSCIFHEYSLDICQEMNVLSGAGAEDESAELAKHWNYTSGLTGPFATVLSKSCDYKLNHVI